MSTLYLICPHGDRLTKIGITTNLDARLRQLQTAYPYPLHVAASWNYDHIEQARSMERCMHQMMRHWQTSGEWFEVEASFVAHVIEHVRSNIALHELIKNEASYGSSIYRLNKEQVCYDRAVAVNKANAIAHLAQHLGFELRDDHDPHERSSIGDMIVAKAAEEYDAINKDH